MISFKSFFSYSCFILLVISCNQNKTTKPTSVSKNTVEEAVGFSIEHLEDYTKLTIKAPYLNSEDVFEFKLSNNPKTKDVIKIPLENIVVTSTTHIAMLEMLGVQEKLVGYPNTDYISSEKTRALIASGAIKELGHEEQINTELLLDLKPDVVIGFSMSSNNKMYQTIENFGIPVILNGDWLEKTPLGRAEWIKFFGLLFDKEKEAAEIYATVTKGYNSAKELAKTATSKPTVLSGGLYKDIWNLPAGESFEATFLRDANSDYLWKDSKGTASLSLSIESVFDRGKDADIWISPSYFSSLDALNNSNEIYANFKAFQEQKIYSFVNKKGPTGGIVYFELAPARPDLVLQDILKIMHPELMTDYSFTFFEALK